MDDSATDADAVEVAADGVANARMPARRRALIRIGAVALGFLVLALGLWVYQGGPAALGIGQSNGALHVGQAAPDFTLKTLDNQSVRLSSFRGKTVLINFWATWCPPCQAEMPAIDKVARGHRDLVVLAVDSMEGPVLVQRFQDQHPYSFRPLLDPSGEVVGRYHVDDLPTSFFVAPDGTIRAINLGPMTQQTIEKDLVATGSN